MPAGGKGAIAGIALVVLFAVNGTLAGCAEEPASSRTTPTTRPALGPTYPTIAAQPTQTVAPSGTAVRDGMFEFQVLKAMKDETLDDPSNPYLTTTAQGLFVIFRLPVRNIGNEPRAYFGQNQQLIDMSGREYQASSIADLHINILPSRATASIRVTRSRSTCHSTCHRTF